MSSSKLQFYPLMIAGILAILLVIVARMSEGTQPLPLPQVRSAAEEVSADEGAVQEGGEEMEEGHEQDLAATPISRYPGIRPFRYMSGGRRDPFIPLLNKHPDIDAISIAQLELTGILWNRDQSLAVLEDKSGKGYPIRIGDNIGNATLTAVKDGAAIFRVVIYGEVHMHTLKLVTEEEMN